SKRDWSSDVCSSDLLTSIFPPGGKQATTVEVTVAGADMDDVEKLVLNHAGLTATPKIMAATALEPARPIPNQFVVTIGKDVSPRSEERRVGKGRVAA